jgi:endonuclease/exonuclease/phosphatase family metal-dependent hydrolase
MARRIPRGAGALALAAAAVLWTAGLVAAVPPLWLRLLLSIAALAGLAALAAGRSGASLDRVAGGVGLGAALFFTAVLFHKGDGAAAVIRRVDPPGAPVERLRLVDFNVLHGYPRFQGQEARRERLAAALAVLDPTVVVLQEAWSVAGHGELAARLGDELGLDVAYAAANGSRRLIGFEEGAAVLSRLPILGARRVALRPRRPLWERRIALFVTLDLGVGERLTVVGVHLANGAPGVADAQARDLAARLPAEGWVIVAGDLNAASDSAAARALTARGLAEALPGGIDHVFAGGRGGPWSIRRARWTLRPRDLARLIGEEAEISDHPGIVVDFVRRL